MIKAEINKWQSIFYIGKDPHYANCHPLIRIGIFNIQRFPTEGNGLSKENYKGFIWCWSFTHPLSVLKAYLENKRY